MGLVAGRLGRLVVVGATVCTLLQPVRAVAGDEFDFRVDRFEVLVAERPSNYSFSDEFDDPALRGWFTQYGTASVGDGMLHLTNPGTKIPNGFGVLPGTTLDLSLVASDIQVSPGADFVARSYWEPDPLAPGDFNHMSLATFSVNGVREVATLALTNLSLDGGPARYEMVQHLLRFVGDGVEVPQVTSVPVDASTISGQIVLELRYDDGHSTVTPRYSLDGGATFVDAFAAMPVFQGAVHGYAAFALGADPLSDLERDDLPPPPICSGGSRGEARIAPDTRTGDTLSMRGTMWVPLRPRDYDPRRDGMQLRIVDRASSETPVVELTGPAALRGRAPGCGPRDGWRKVPHGFVYRNETDALPPACTPGSAGGVRRVRLKKLGRRATGFDIALATSWRPAPEARVAITILLGDAPAAATERCSTTEVRCTGDGASLDCARESLR